MELTQSLLSLNNRDQSKIKRSGKMKIYVEPPSKSGDLGVFENLDFISHSLYIQGVPYTMSWFRTAGISFVLKLESRYFHNMFHISIGFMC